MLSDAIIGHGEIWCACLFAARLRLEGHCARMLDASDVLIVEPTADGQSVDVDYDVSNANLDTWAQQNGIPDVIVCTGFIARNRCGQVRRAAASHVLAEVEHRASPRPGKKCMDLRLVSPKHGWLFGLEVPRSARSAMHACR